MLSRRAPETPVGLSMCTGEVRCFAIMRLNQIRRGKISPTGCGELRKLIKLHMDNLATQNPQNRNGMRARSGQLSGFPIPTHIPLSSSSSHPQTRTVSVPTVPGSMPLWPSPPALSFGRRQHPYASSMFFGSRRASEAAMHNRTMHSTNGNAGKQKKLERSRLRMEKMKARENLQNERQKMSPREQDVHDWIGPSSSYVTPRAARALAMQEPIGDHDQQDEAQAQFIQAMAVPQFLEQAPQQVPNVPVLPPRPANIPAPPLPPAVQQRVSLERQLLAAIAARGGANRFVRPEPAFAHLRGLLEWRPAHMHIPQAPEFVCARPPYRVSGPAPIRAPRCLPLVGSNLNWLLFNQRRRARFVWSEISGHLERGHSVLESVRGWPTLDLKGWWAFFQRCLPKRKVYKIEPRADLVSNKEAYFVDGHVADFDSVNLIKKGIFDLKLIMAKAAALRGGMGLVLGTAVAALSHCVSKMSCMSQSPLLLGVAARAIRCSPVLGVACGVLSLCFSSVVMDSIVKYEYRIAADPSHTQKNVGPTTCPQADVDHRPGPYRVGKPTDGPDIQSAQIVRKVLVVRYLCPMFEEVARRDFKYSRTASRSMTSAKILQHDVLGNDIVTTERVNRFLSTASHINVNAVGFELQNSVQVARLQAATEFNENPMHVAHKGFREAGE